jgi:hypothetical protein
MLSLLEYPGEYLSITTELRKRNHWTKVSEMPSYRGLNNSVETLVQGLREATRMVLVRGVTAGRSCKLSRRDRIAHDIAPDGDVNRAAEVLRQLRARDGRSVGLSL